MPKFKKVNPKQNFPKLEEEITHFWKKNKIFEKSVENRPKSNRYVFYDGPPFITGMPHYGSLLPSIAKDVVPRYWTMKGKRVERVWGWDCHGLPIENKVEKKLNLKNRRDIEKLGIQRFIDECYSYTTQVSSEWEWYIDKIGRWVDFKNSYKTMDQDYMETVIWVFKQLWEKKLIYKGTRVSLYCTRCGTPISNFEIAMDNSYSDMPDPAVSVKFKAQYHKTGVGVGIVIFNEDGEILMAQRNEEGREKSIGIVGGKKEDDDKDILETAKRESLEEIGVIPENLELVGSSIDIFEGRLFHTHHVKGFLKKDTKFKTNNSLVNLTWVKTKDIAWDKLHIPTKNTLLDVLKGEHNFKIPKETKPDVNLIAWTTTPWTLPSNRALVVAKDEDYSLIEIKRTKKELKKIAIILLDKEKGKVLALRHSNKWYEPIMGENTVNTDNVDELITKIIKDNTGYNNTKVIKKLGNLKDTYITKKTIQNLDIDYYLVELENTEKEKSKKNNLEQVWLDVKNIDKIPGAFGLSKFAELTKIYYQTGKIEELKIHETKNFSENEFIVLATKRIKEVLEDFDYEIKDTFKGKELVGLSYIPPFNMFPAKNDNEFKVYTYKNMVTMNEGTGIVHSAPGFGDIDTEMAREYGISIMQTVDDEGKFRKDADFLTGMYVKKADPFVIIDLNKRGLLLKEERITHRYPYCYRCETPLIHKAQPSWFVDIQGLKKDMLKNNENINWVPSHLKYGRFKKGIEVAPDWCISRTRYWATPMPVWKCDKCEHIEVLGSRKEIEEKSGQKVIDLHRPKIDQITYKCPKCEGTMKRIPEVLDVWMDSGSMPYAQKHYPFEKRKEFEENYPADFIVEYIAQTRAWFYTLHVVSTALFNKNAFKNVVTTGVIFGTDGRKMSKSYGNYPDPKDILTKYGAEPLRMYLMSSRIMVGEDINFDEEGLKEQLKSFILPLWNSYSFFVTYANLFKFKPDAKLLHNNLEIRDNVQFVKGTKVDTYWYKVPDIIATNKNKLDIWIVAKLQLLIRDVRIAMDNYDIPAAARLYPEFIQHLSKWYIRRSRNRFAAGDKNAFNTLYYVLIEFSKLLSFLMPFIVEEIWQNLVKTQFTDQPESIHLTELPQDDLDFVEKHQRILTQMDAVREVVNLGQSIRTQEGIKVKQPLEEMEVYLNLTNTRDKELEEWMKELIKDELNIKLIDEDRNPSQAQGWIYKENSDGNIKISLNTNITDELKREGITRELIRKIQYQRKNHGLELGQKASIIFNTINKELLIVLDLFKSQIERETNSSITVNKKQPSNIQKIEGLEFEIKILVE